MISRCCMCATARRPTYPRGSPSQSIGEDLRDEAGLFTQRFDATPGATYLLRPDHHLGRALARLRPEQDRGRARPRPRPLITPSPAPSLSPAWRIDFIMSSQAA